MSIRAKFLGFVDVIMRIPPLFLLDEILKMNFFDSSQINISVEQLNETIINNSNLTEEASISLDIFGLTLTMLKLLVFLLGKCLTRRHFENGKNLRKLFLQSFLSSSSR